MVPGSGSLKPLIVAVSGSLTHLMLPGSLGHWVVSGSGSLTDLMVPGSPEHLCLGLRSGGCWFPYCFDGCWYQFSGI